MLTATSEIIIVALNLGSPQKSPPHANCEVTSPIIVAAIQKKIAVFSMANSKEKPALFLKNESRLTMPAAVNRMRPVFIKAP